jgi:hypothetical protein
LLRKLLRLLFLTIFMWCLMFLEPL